MGACPPKFLPPRATVGGWCATRMTLGHTSDLPLYPVPRVQCIICNCGSRSYSRNRLKWLPFSSPSPGAANQGGRMPRSALRPCLLWLISGAGDRLAAGDCCTCACTPALLRRRRDQRYHSRAIFCQQETSWSFFQAIRHLRQQWCVCAGTYVEPPVISQYRPTAAPLPAVGTAQCVSTASAGHQQPGCLSSKAALSALLHSVLEGKWLAAPPLAHD